MIEDDLYARLSGFSGLSALVGSRIYPNFSEQNDTYPAIFYQRISSTRLHSMEGSSGFVDALFEFNCFADSFDSACAVANQLRLCLDGWRSAVAGIGIGAVFLVNEEDFFEQEIQKHRRLLEFEVIHNESLPA